VKAGGGARFVEEEVQVVEVKESFPLVPSRPETKGLLLSEHFSGVHGKASADAEAVIPPRFTSCAAQRLAE